MKQKQGRTARKGRRRKGDEASETRLLIEYAFDMAKKLSISKLFVRADQLIDQRLVERNRSDEILFWLTADGEIPSDGDATSRDQYIRIPGLTVGGFHELTFGLTTAVLQNRLRVDESAICLTGTAGSNRLDNLLVINPKRDLRWFRDHRMSVASKRIASDEGIRLLDLALRFGAEGREGKPIGTIFLLGNPRQLKKYTRPLILNPLSGHSDSARSIHNPDFHETLRELSAIDGAFIINTRGVVQRAGVYLDAPANEKTDVKEGLGARHVAAAAISARTNSIAIVISESSGSVTVFADGASILELDGRT